jgi:hypothetical protein
MKTSDILVKKSVFCVFDINLPFVNLTEMVLGMDDEQGRFVFQLINKYYEDISAGKASYAGDAFLENLLSEGKDPFEKFVTYTADEIHHLMVNNPEIQQGSGIFVWAVLGEQEYIVFFKLNYQAGFICQVEENGLVSWKRNNKIIPTASKKLTEFLYLNISEKTVMISGTECYVDGEKTNYLASKICRLETGRSERETIEAITDAIAETIEEKYESRVPEKLMEYKKTIANMAEEKGVLDREEITEKIFADNTDAAERFSEKMEEKKFSQEPLQISGKMERRLQKKQKIVTDSGIEILVPLEFLKDTSVFEYVQDETGKVCIMIKDAGKIIP